MDEQAATLRDCQAAYDFWTAACSALVFACLRERGQGLIASLEQQSIRRHQAAHFAQGLRKLGLHDEPNDVVRCAKYHYLGRQ